MGGRRWVFDGHVGGRGPRRCVGDVVEKDRRASVVGDGRARTALEGPLMADVPCIVRLCGCDVVAEDSL